MPAARYTEVETADKLEEIRRMVKEGKTDAAIARELGLTKAQLSRWRQSRPLIREALTRLVTVDGKRIDSHDLNTGHPPRKVDNVTRLQVKVDQWLEACKRDDVPPTRSGLCLMLGISKQTLSRYLQDTGVESTVYQPDPITGKLTPVTVQDILKRAILAIEHAIELRMLTGKSNVAGAIFDLKNNHGYADKTEVSSTSTITKTTDERDIDARIAELLKRQEQARPFKKQA